VAVKVQFPGVARSIDSDLGNLGRLLRMSNVVPPGLFLDRVLDFAKKELKEECDYQLEARNQIRFRRQVGQDTHMQSVQ
jgi:aarF domain-containing kinase